MKIDHTKEYTDRELEIIFLLLEKAISDLNANPMLKNNRESIKSIGAIEYVRDKTQSIIELRNRNA